MNLQTLALYNWMKSHNMPVSHYCNLSPYFRNLLKNLVLSKPQLKLVK